MGQPTDVHLPLQTWALSVFLNFFNNKKLFFAFLTGSGLFK